MIELDDDELFGVDPCELEGEAQFESEGSSGVSEESRTGMGVMGYRWRRRFST